MLDPQGHTSQIPSLTIAAERYRSLETDSMSWAPQGAVQTMLRCHSQPDEVQRSTSIGHVLLLLKLLRAAKTMPQALMSATAQALPHIFDAAADCMCLETFTAVACLSSEFRDAVSLFAADTCKRR